MASALSRMSKPFFSTARPTLRRCTGAPDRSRRGPNALAGEGAEAGEVEAVIAEMDVAASRRGARDARSRSAVQVTVQRAEPACRLEIPVRRRPDVLGMRRAGPGDAGEQAGIAGAEAGVWMKCACSHSPPSGHSAASTSACPNRRKRLRVESCARSAAKAASARQKPAPARQAAEGPQHAQRLFVQIFREIEDRRADLVMDRMALLSVGRRRATMTRSRAGLLQAEQLLRDKGLRQPRIAFQDDHDLAPHVLPRDRCRSSRRPPEAGEVRLCRVAAQWTPFSSNPACGRARPLSRVKIALRHSPVKPNAAPAAEEEIVDLYRL